MTDELYAITDKSFRAISTPADAVAEETVVTQVPRSLIDSIAAKSGLKESNAATLRANAELALVDLRAYRDLATPTNAQTAAIVKTLVIVAIGTIKLTLGKLDSTT